MKLIQWRNGWQGFWRIFLSITRGAMLQGQEFDPTWGQGAISWLFPFSIIFQRAKLFLELTNSIINFWKLRMKVLKIQFSFFCQAFWCDIAAISLPDNLRLLCRSHFYFVELFVVFFLKKTTSIKGWSVLNFGLPWSKVMLLRIVRSLTCKTSELACLQVTRINWNAALW